MIHRDEVVDLLDKSRAIKLYVGKHRVEYDLCNGHSIFFMYKDDYGKTVEYIKIEQNDFGRKYGYEGLIETHIILPLGKGWFMTRVSPARYKFTIHEKSFYKSLEDFMSETYAITDEFLNDANKKIGFEGKPAIQQMVYLGEWS